MQNKKRVAFLLFVFIFLTGLFFLNFLFLKNTDNGDFLTKIYSYFEKTKNREEEGFPKDSVVRLLNNNEGFLTREGIIEETNNQRNEFSLGYLFENEILNNVAEKKIDDMFAKQYFAHISPQKEGVADIAEEANYKYLLIGDNLALGSFTDDEDVVDAWMKSPGHRKNILGEKYTEIGVGVKKGVYNNKNVWMAVQVFAMPQSACPGVDETIPTRIEQKKKEVEELLRRKDELEYEIDNIVERGSEEHIEKVNEYNSLIPRNNELVDEINRLVDEYNRQLKERESCINKQSK